MINVFDFYREYKNRGVIPFYKGIYNYYKNSNVKYKVVKTENWKDYKKSDTIFLLGSGPSINNISSSDWDIINEHDSMGLNHVFLTKKRMTYYLCGYEKHAYKIFKKIFTPEIRSIYKDTLWFQPLHSMYRLYHPRTIPEFFPEITNLAIFDAPKAIFLESDREFTIHDFYKSIIYRGVVCFGLYLITKLKYKKVVLLGVDLHTSKHFFDNYKELEERQWYNKFHQEHSNGLFESMVPKDAKFRRMDEYYYALNELYFKEKGIKLFVQSKNNILYPRIPIYPAFNKSN